MSSSFLRTAQLLQNLLPVAKKSKKKKNTAASFRRKNGSFEIVIVKKHRKCNRFHTPGGGCLQLHNLQFDRILSPKKSERPVLKVELRVLTCVNNHQISLQ